jgi:hypothetical protein
MTTEVGSPELRCPYRSSLIVSTSRVVLTGKVRLPQAVRHGSLGSLGIQQGFKAWTYSFGATKERGIKEKVRHVAATSVLVKCA